MAADLRVFFAVRGDWQRRPGGDTVQIRWTAEGLSALGVDVTVSGDTEADLSGYDLVHLFHLTRVHESYPHFANARRQKRPIVVSTIYWPWRRGVLAGLLGDVGREAVERAKNVVRAAKGGAACGRLGAVAAAMAGVSSRCRRIVAASAMLLPNSQAEADVLRREFGEGLRLRVIVNGVPGRICREILGGATGQRHRRLLCVGHFDPRKNQLRLIEAMRDLDIPGFFIGGPRGMHVRYFRKCRARATGNVHFLGPMPHGEALAWMRDSAVFVCPSHAETPGLASLEAAAMGCALALGSCPPVVEYFGSDAAYFDPRSPAAMRETVLRAIESSPPRSLSERILSQCDWSVAARQTLAAYEAALAQ
jgi:glycosyltransferase involved in cell wall biosynthesis